MAGGKKSKFDLAVSALVTELRLKHGYTQQDFATMLNCSRNFISMVESANADKHYNLEQLNRLAFELECSIWELVPKLPIREDNWE